MGERHIDTESQRDRETKRDIVREIESNER